MQTSSFSLQLILAATMSDDVMPEKGRFNLASMISRHGEGGIYPQQTPFDEEAQQLYVEIR